MMWKHANCESVATALEVFDRSFIRRKRSFAVTCELHRNDFAFGDITVGVDLSVINLHRYVIGLECVELNEGCYLEFIANLQLFR